MWVSWDKRKCIIIIVYIIIIVPKPHAIFLNLITCAEISSQFTNTQLQWSPLSFFQDHEVNLRIGINRDNSVSKIRNDQISIPGSDRGLYIFHHVQTGFWAHQASYPMNTPVSDWVLSYFIQWRCINCRICSGRLEMIMSHEFGWMWKESTLLCFYIVLFSIYYGGNEQSDENRSYFSLLCFLGV
jgi:hypothetical protein